MQFLSKNLAGLASNFPGLDPAALLQALASSYNHGFGQVSKDLNTGVSTDLNSKGVNNGYGANILELMACF